MEVELGAIASGTAVICAIVAEVKASCHGAGLVPSSVSLCSWNRLQLLRYNDLVQASLTLGEPEGGAVPKLL